MNDPSEHLQKRLAFIRQHTLLQPEDHLMADCIEEAIAAGIAGNYPAGCMIVDSALNIVARGRNASYKPYPNSAAHAEMEAISAVERNHAILPHSDELVLYTTLEPCIMCTARILFSKVRKVVYLCHDPSDGGLAILPYLPSGSAALSEHISFAAFTEEAQLQNLGSTLYEWGEERWRAAQLL